MVSPDTLVSVPRYQVREMRASRLAHDLDAGHENISRAALGADELHATARVDLPAQASDLHVDGAVVDLVVVEPGLAQELVARQHALRRREKGGEQVELAVGEAQGVATRQSEPAQAHRELVSAEPVGPD